MKRHLFRLPPYVQYCGEDIEALAVAVGMKISAVGVGMNLVPILASNKKARIGTLFLSDLERIMALLSDDGVRRLLEWIRSEVAFSDSNFEPR
jgi:hypothetical protein